MSQEELSARRAGLSGAKRAMLEKLLQGKTARASEKPAIPRRAARDRYPLSSAQRQLWFLDQILPENPFYVIPAAVQLKGELDREILARSLNEVVKRHEVLRSSFLTADGQPMQAVAPTLTLAIPVVDLEHLNQSEREAEARRVAAQEALRPFDLSRIPLLRVTLIKLADEDHIMLLMTHHIVFDEWSMGALLREIASFYEAAVSGREIELRDLPLQYADYAAWQQEWLNTEAYRTQLDYWQEQLAGSPAGLELPADHLRPSTPTFKGGRSSLPLTPEIAQGLKDLSDIHGATLVMTLLGAFKVLLYRYTGQEDIVIGLPVATRNHQELEGLLGCFVNTLVLRTSLAGRPSFSELLGRVKRVTLGAYAHQDIPFEHLVERLQPERDLSRNPLCNVFFVSQNVPMPSLSLGGLELTPLEVDSEVSRLDLVLGVRESDAGLTIYFEYSRDLFEDETIRRMADHFQNLLKAIIADPHQKVPALPMLSEAEQRQQLDWGTARADFPADKCVPELFQAMVEQYPDAIAVGAESQMLTYRELNRRANKLAHHLRGLGIGPEVRVGICVERSASLVIGLLGILKAGGAYVPLDPSYPIERLSFMLEDSQAPVLLTETKLDESLPSYWGQVVYLDEDWAAIEQCGDANPDSMTSAENLAYVMYTSGSTGLPKAVAISHLAIARLILNSNYIRLSPSHRIAQLSNSSFDAATFEVWGSLLSGASLFIIPRLVSLSPLALALALDHLNISTLFLTTALFNEMARQLPSAFNKADDLLVGGEAIDASSVREVLAAGGPGRLLNVYGPTECTTFATWQEVSSERSFAQKVPIGKPISNTRAYVLDTEMRMVGAGVIGELYLGGEGLARGYLGEGGQTAEKFVPDSLRGEGERMYATGDLARYDAEGRIEYVGRRDRQVKLRGFRIELHEIEVVLKKYPGVQESAVILRRENSDERRLIAYIAAAPEQAPSTSELRRYVKKKLPEYMMPNSFVLVDKMPLTLNGKVDQQALLAMKTPAAQPTEDFVAPRTQTEKLLAEVWAEVLNLGQVGIHDNFFELGGDSILSIQALSRAKVRGLDISVHQIFQHPTIHGLAQAISPDENVADKSRIDKSRPDKSRVATPFSLISADDRQRVPPGIEDAYPLTRLQAGMLFHREYDPAATVYHELIAFRVQAQFDAGAMRAAIQALAERHAILRTSFDLTGFSEPLQLVHRIVEIPIVIEDARHLSPTEQERAFANRVEREKNHYFVWADPPLLRFTLQLRDDQAFDSLITVSHTIVDGWSLSTLVTELFQHYWLLLGHAGGSLPATPEILFRDYVALERAAIESEECHLFWREKLRDSAIVKLPRWPASRSGEAPSQVKSREIVVSPGVPEGLNRLAKSLNVPMRTVLLAAHTRVLSLLTGQERVITGLPLNGRPEEAGGERVIGLFLNTVPFQMNLPGGSWEDLLRETFQAEMELLPYRRYPLPDLQKLCGGKSLFEVAFNYTHFHVIQDIANVKLMDMRLTAAVVETNFTLLASFELHPITGELHMRLDYDAAELSAEQVESACGYYARAFEAMVADPGQRYDTCLLLSDEEQRMLLRDWNDTVRDYPRNRCIHELFEEQARRNGAAVAVVAEGESLTYAELNLRANQLAGYLRSLGVKPEVKVGVCLGRSLEMIVGLLGVLKAGGAYVPLDPTYPAERLGFLLSDARIPVLLTVTGISTAQLDSRAQTVYLDAHRDMIAQYPDVDAASNVTPENLAYAIYTSGSTGIPKGVEISHRNVTRLLFGVDYAELDSDKIFLQMAPLAFDASTFEIWGALLHGACLILYPQETPAASGIGALVSKHGVTTAWLTSSLFNAVIQEDPEALGGIDELLIGGEALSASHVKLGLERLPSTRIINGYGPTESATFTCTHHIGGEEGERTDSIPIGRPISNTQVCILDSNLMPAPVGVAGELFIAGDGLGRGYLNRPDLTSEKFIPHAFSSEPGERLYRTGDLARYLPGGEIEFVGRLDHQVKVRGHRIELGEVEIVLSKHPAVQEAIVTATDGDSGPRRLVAYVVAREGGRVTASELRSYLKEKLPDYMIPSATVFMDELPLTRSGKIDRRALPTPEALFPEPTRAYIQPQTPAEEMLAAIWSNVLKLERIGRYDNFFESGGDSILATQVVSRIRQVFKVSLPLAALFESPSLFDLGEKISEAVRVKGEIKLQPLRPVARTGPLPLSHAQERLWFLDQFEPGSAVYNINTAVGLKGRLDMSALERSFNEIVRRHEVLRTAFSSIEGQPVQIITAPRVFRLPLIDLSSLTQEEQEAESNRLLREEAQRSFNLEQGRLFRVTLLRLSEQYHVVLFPVHHIVSDGWSRGVLVKELAALYEAYATGRESPLSELEIQYADFAVWQRQWLKDGAIQAQLKYWKKQLADAPARLELPRDRPHPAMQTLRGSLESTIFSQDLLRQLKKLSRNEGVTLFMTLLAAFKTLLYRYTGQEDMVIGSPIANRTRREVEELIGFFVNTLALRTKLNGNLTFTELLKRVRGTALEAYAHQDLPFEMLVEELRPVRTLTHSPLFQVMCALQNAPMQPPGLQGLALELLTEDNETAKFDLTLFMQESEEGLAAAFEYNTDLFDAATIRRMLNHFGSLLTSIAADPQKPLRDLGLLGQEELEALAALNDTATDFPRNQSLHQLFEAQAAQTPAAVAISYDGEQITYRELNRRANQLAHRLRGLGVGPEKLVGLCVERSPQMIIGMLGILKSGGAYLPLDPSYPKQRLTVTLNHANVEVLLTQQSLVEHLPEHRARLICLDTDWEIIARESAENLANLTLADNLAYVMYTSGSTGLPKAVAISHLAIARLILNSNYIRLSPSHRIAQLSNSSFDAATFEVWGSLLSGASLFIIPRLVSLSPLALALALDHLNISTLFLTTALFNEMARQLPSAFNKADDLLVGGEAIDASSVREVLAAGGPGRLLNVYGPTECTTFATWQEVSSEHSFAQKVPIGKPISNTRAYVLDTEMRMVGAGVIGELYLGGEGLARGYLGEGGQTAEKFVPDSLRGEGERMYATGDLARYDAEGRIEYVGRRDRQVKLRGFRIELHEIEATLAEHSMVSQAVIETPEIAPGDKRVIAYVVPQMSLRNLGESLAATQWQEEYISHWRTLFDENYNQPSQQQDTTFNVAGWESSYTGSPIPAEEMSEWTEATVEQVLSYRPGRVLEIGCGTGLLLFRIAPHTTKYWGTDFSKVTLDYVERELAKSDRQLPVKLLHREADDFEGIEPNSFDAVILNSIVQYFPSADYLQRVIEGALRAVDSGGLIYVGDLRSLPLLEAYQASVQFYKAPAEMETAELQERIRRGVLREEELVVHPEFFLALKENFPRVSHVEIVPKRGKYHNELTRFRYQVIIRVGASDQHRLKEVNWLDWQKEPLSVAAIRELLSKQEPEFLCLRAVSNSRLSTEAKLLEMLKAPGRFRTVGELRADLEKSPPTGLDPEELWTLGEELPYSVRIDWAGHERYGAFDVILARRANIDKDAKDASALTPDDPLPVKPWQEYTNNPLHNKFLHLIVPQLRDYAKERLPAYMVPSAFVILNELPLTPNGKVDRRALPLPETARPKVEGPLVGPRNIIEFQLSRIWEDLLDVAPIDVRENFFDLGGHSLLAIQLLSKIQKALGVNVPVATLFKEGSIERLADFMRQHPGSMGRSSLVDLKPGGTGLPFFCVHPGGGGVLCYVSLARRLGADQPFFGFQSRGLNDSQEPSLSIEEMARNYIEDMRSIQPDGPYLLGGWSMGGIVAFEMARQLQSQGQRVRQLALIDSVLPSPDERALKLEDSILMPRFFEDLLGLSARHRTWSEQDFKHLEGDRLFDSLMKEARLANVLPEEMDGGHVRRLFDVFKTNVQAALNYVPQAGSFPISLFVSSETLARPSGESKFGWGLWSADVQVYPVPGTHYTLLSEPQVEVLAEKLKACFAQAADK